VEGGRGTEVKLTSPMALQLERGILIPSYFQEVLKRTGMNDLLFGGGTLHCVGNQGGKTIHLSHFGDKAKREGGGGKRAF